MLLSRLIENKVDSDARNKTIRINFVCENLKIPFPRPYEMQPKSVKQEMSKAGLKLPISGMYSCGFGNINKRYIQKILKSAPR